MRTTTNDKTTNGTRRASKGHHLWGSISGPLIFGNTRIYLNCMTLYTKPRLAWRPASTRTTAASPPSPCRSLSCSTQKGEKPRIFGVSGSTNLTINGFWQSETSYLAPWVSQDIQQDCEGPKHPSSQSKLCLPCIRGLLEGKHILMRHRPLRWNSAHTRIHHGETVQGLRWYSCTEQ